MDEPPLRRQRGPSIRKGLRADSMPVPEWIRERIESRIREGLPPDFVVDLPKNTVPIPPPSAVPKHLLPKAIRESWDDGPEYMKQMRSAEALRMYQMEYLDRDVQRNAERAERRERSAETRAQLKEERRALNRALSIEKRLKQEARRQQALDRELAAVRAQRQLVDKRIAQERADRVAKRLEQLLWESESGDAE